jgi:catechol 2,3-dioxygenase-like lactoylglutathione lyase family enzyme
MKPTRILETILYADDLEGMARFYRDVLGLEPTAGPTSRQVFFRVGDQMLLIFNPEATRQGVPPEVGLPIPRHGAVGEGHVCFRATADEITAWRARLEQKGVVIESDFEWPGGGRSIYFRDPAGNSVEFAEARIWGIE